MMSNRHGGNPEGHPHHVVHLRLEGTAVLTTLPCTPPDVNASCGARRSPVDDPEEESALDSTRDTHRVVANHVAHTPGWCPVVRRRVGPSTTPGAKRIADGC
eukprot:2370419-Amphidinium_carterae.1